MSTTATVSQDEYKKALKEFYAATQKFEKVVENLEPESVMDLTLTNWDGETVHLSDLFGDKDDLIIIHNMGASCSHCTLWADGFIGLQPHIENRAAFAVVSPDQVDAQKKFADSRGWAFQMLSSHGHTFVSELGFDSEDHDTNPGYSVFHKNADGSIERTGWDHFGPSDRYCGIWPMFSNLKGGAGDWNPKYKY